MASDPPTKKSFSPAWWVGFGLLCCWTFLVILSKGVPLSFLPLEWQSGFAWEVDNGLMPTGTWLVVHGLGCGLLFAFFYALKRGKATVSVAAVIALSVALRLVAMWGEPIHESDFYRYVWDGKSSLAGINPYRFEPGAIYLWQQEIEEPFQDPATEVMWRGRVFTEEEELLLGRLDALRLEDPQWFARISHQAVTTIYPPMAQVVFGLSASMGGWSVYGLKFILIAFDIGIVCLLLSLARRMGIPQAWVVLYAWNPLVIKEFANSAHYDAVPVFFSVLALWVATQTASGGNTRRKAILVGAIVALGTLSKYFTILLLPVLLIWLARKEDPRSGWRSLFSGEVILGSVVFSGVVALSFLPFFFWNDAGFSNVFSGLKTYSENWQYNPGFFALVERSLAWLGISDSFRIAKIVSALVLSVTAVTLALLPMRNGKELATRCFSVMAALFLVSPTAFPWYFCWVLAFIIFQAKWSWLLLGALLPLNYFDFQPERELALSHYSIGGFYVFSLAIWFIFYLAWIGEWRFGKSR